VAAQAAEHSFVGTKSGLMDQLTATFGVKNHCMLIDCRSLDRKLTPLQVPGFTVVVCDTAVKHKLATSAYNQRRLECEESVALLRTYDTAIRSLRDVTSAELESYVDRLPQTLYHRSRHVVSENERTVAAVQALVERDVNRLGELMNLSHESLRDDYEVSCPELDLMVQLSRRLKCVVGARMMGGGFGGSTVNLVGRDAVSEFRERVSEAYQLATGLTPSIFPVEADDGVGETT
jgi:galactokinase